MNWATCPLAELPAHIFARLDRATRHPGDPMRTPVLGTIGGGRVAMRTVVLREVHADERRVVCHTDVRSAKIGQLHAHPAATWMFSDPVELVQVRAKGRTTIHCQNQLARRLWDQLPAVSRLNYCTTNPPGTELRSPEFALPPGLRGQKPTAENTIAGWENFAVVITAIERLDWLWLAAAGHRRAIFGWKARAWKGQWVTP
ncbi:MAG: pyridoxamine 5'-phosphate oxidase family protein [Verrucomicrobia bacterium]|nr:pyridoxamine 5'-phosphate oxidase family protein [Verrucomicrobiota bacterium]